MNFSFVGARFPRPHRVITQFFMGPSTRARRPRPYGIILGIILVVIPNFVFSSDALETLIDDEKKARAEWTQDDEDLPPAYLWGDSRGVDLTAPSICQPLAFDELIELSQGRPSDLETILNLDLPRVQGILQSACLIRPQDSLLAIGDGIQRRVMIKDFVIRRAPAPCAEDYPYSLWGHLTEELDVPPLFFTTETSWPEHENGYQKAVEFKSIPDENELRKRISFLVTDQNEFTISHIPVIAPNVSRFIVLRRKVASFDDEGLPNEIILSETPQGLEILWRERVDMKKGSGFIKMEGLLDFNGDGWLDLFISGVHQGCPYRMMFKGSGEGFHALDLPLKPCGCP